MQRTGWACQCVSSVSGRALLRAAFDDGELGLEVVNGGG